MALNLSEGLGSDDKPCVQTVLRIAGAVRRDLYDRPSTHVSTAPFPRATGAIVAEFAWDCATVTVRGAVTARPACSSSVPPHFAHAHIWWKQLCAINYEPKVALPSKFCPRTHQLSRGWREISPRVFRQSDWRRIPQVAGLPPRLGG